MESLRSPHSWALAFSKDDTKLENMSTFDSLKKLYNRFRKNYRGNPDSGQMCCMWSTSNPPDDIYNSDQIISIEKEFNIELSEDQVLEIYDMDLSEAVIKINSIRQNQC
jgi:hypothetical protein